jgi:hypothetical protein
MTPPRRLVEDGTAFERAVLTSARLDVVGEDGLKRTLVALGAGAAAISTTTSTASAGLAAGGGAATAAGGATVLFGGIGVGAAMKWLGVAVAVMCAGTAVTAASMSGRGSARLDRRTAPAAAALSMAAAPPTCAVMNATGGPPPEHGSPPEPTTTGDTAAVVEAVTPVASGGSMHPAPLAASSVAARTASSLDMEVAALDRVRSALAERDATRAIEELDAYDRAFPSPVLRDEATVLRVDALVEQGNRAGAEALARRFLLANPRSPHASHLVLVLRDHNW